MQSEGPVWISNCHTKAAPSIVAQSELMRLLSAMADDVTTPANSMCNPYRLEVVWMDGLVPDNLHHQPSCRPLLCDRSRLSSGFAHVTRAECDARVLNGDDVCDTQGQVVY
uniref:WGS project CBMF000000000 data, contig CS5834_c000533 n=1 Tax=Fusarium pseudograminearum CS5834 TaxID=1318459 RepID=A0A096PF44_FUSPS|nr:unnamed protein product [Fusarium pseudograminearum CS5834]